MRHSFMHDKFGANHPDRGAIFPPLKPGSAVAPALRPLDRKGPVVSYFKIPVDATALAKSLGVAWPHNGLRYS